MAMGIQGMNQVTSKVQIIAASISTLYFSLFSIGSYWFIHQFEEVFEAFGTSLPIQTSVIIGSYRYWGISALVSAFVLFKVSQSENHKAMVILAWLVALSLVIVPFTIWGLYGPPLEASG